MDDPPIEESEKRQQHLLQQSRNKRPELARYQPPSTRGGGGNAPTTSQATNSKSDELNSAAASASKQESRQENDRINPRPKTNNSQQHSDEQRQNKQQQQQQQQQQRNNHQTNEKKQQKQPNQNREKQPTSNQPSQIQNPNKISAKPAEKQATERSYKSNRPSATTSEKEPIQQRENNRQPVKSIDNRPSSNHNKNGETSNESATNKTLNESLEKVKSSEPQKQQQRENNRQPVRSNDNRPNSNHNRHKNGETSNESAANKTLNESLKTSEKPQPRQPIKSNDNRPTNNHHKNGETSNELVENKVLNESLERVKISEIPPQQQERKPHLGGLIKLDKNRLEEAMGTATTSTTSNRQPSSKQHHSHKQHANETNEANMRMLFDPLNPDKPIFVSSNKRAANGGNKHHQQQINDRSVDVNQGESFSISSKESTATKNNESVNKVNHLAKQIQYLEAQLKQMIDSFDTSRASEFLDYMAKINQLRSQLESLCKESLFTNIETSSELNMDVNHWRSCYHQLIEHLRKEHHYHQQQQNRDSNIILTQLNTLINEGFNFYETLIGELERKYLKFKHDHYIAVNYYDQCQGLISQQQESAINPVIRSKEAKYALMTVQRSLISLGDLERYRELLFGGSALNQMRDYSQARVYYLKAMFLAPKSSRAYHQLAILAIYTRRRLDACYYYFRCLELSTPLNSVRQSLITIFEECRSKTDSINKMIKQAILNKRKMAASRRRDVETARHREEKHRREVWYRSGGGDNQQPKLGENSGSSSSSSSSSSSDDESTSDGDESDEDDDNTQKRRALVNIDDDEASMNSLTDEKKLSTNELTKRFMLNYLNSVGKLFTKVGMESYPDVCSQMLHELKALLKRSPCPLGRVRLMQINVINIAVIDLVWKQAQVSAPHLTSENDMIVRSQQLECAIQLSLDVFALLAMRFVKLLKNSTSNNDEDLISDLGKDPKPEWSNLLVSIKIFIEWLLCNLKLWYPLPDQLSPDLGPNPNRWQSMIDLFNTCSQIAPKLAAKTPSPPLYPIKLDEDIELSGFVPLLPRDDEPSARITPNNRDYIMSLDENSVEAEKAKKRMDKILLFADYLCGLEKQPLVEYDVKTKAYSLSPAVTTGASAPVNRNIALVKSTMRTTSTCSSSSLKSEEGSVSGAKSDNLSDSMGSEMSELKEKHRALKAKIEEQQRKEMDAASLIDEATSQQRPIELEIRPKFIVADTNCFVDHLDLIDRILATSYFILVVPLLVVSELEHLAKSVASLMDDSLEHAEYVQNHARRALAFLNDKFESRQVRNIKAMTAQGSVLETIQFRTEEISKPGTNDDLILGCCLYYCRDNARDFMPNSKSDAIRLYRDVVLLTEDRHLRMKAHSRNVPVKTIIGFCKWANLTPTANQHRQNNKKTRKAKK